MNNKSFLIKLYFLFCLFFTNAFADKFNYFDDGKMLFEKENYEESKFLFEKDIVFNPKNEKSYLYLAKIFNKSNNEEEEEINLNSVLLLNPKNDEAMYLLALLKIKQSDYKNAKDLIENFNQVCSLFCDKKNEIEQKLKKLTP